MEWEVAQIHHLLCMLLPMLYMLDQYNYSQNCPCLNGRLNGQYRIPGDGIEWLVEQEEKRNGMLIIVGEKDSPDFSYNTVHHKVMHTWFDFDLQKTDWNQSAFGSYF